MAWKNIVGHDVNYDRFNRTWQNDRIASTYLFVGAEGIGKRSFALCLAQSLFCAQRSEFTDLGFCGQCQNCQLVRSSNHPDLLYVSKPSDKNFIPVELLIGDREHRRQQGLCHDLHLTPFNADRKIAIIDDADYLNVEGANCLLKTLEEPPPDSILILLATSEHRQLPTILSRSQIVRFDPLTSDQIELILKQNELVENLGADSLAAAAAGSLEEAVWLDDPDRYAMRSRLFTQLATLDPADSLFAKDICAFVDGVSKDATLRRDCLRRIAAWTIQWCGRMLRQTHQINSNNQSDKPFFESEDQFKQSQSNAVRNADEILSDWIDRTATLQRQIDTNMAIANIVPLWLNDLGALARDEKILV